MDALGHRYDAPSSAAGEGDEVFKALVLARIVERTSKVDSLRALDEVDVDPSSYRIVK